MDLIKSDITVDSIEVSNNTLEIEIKEFNMLGNFELYLIQKTNESNSEKLNYTYVDDKLKIDLNSIEIEETEIGEWSFCIKAIFDKYILMQYLQTLENTEFNYLFDGATNRTIQRGIYIAQNKIIYGQDYIQDYLKKIGKSVKENVLIKDINFTNDKINLFLSGHLISSSTIGRLIFVSRKTNDEVSFLLYPDKGMLSSEVSMDNMQDELEKGRWDIFAQVLDKDNYLLGRVEQIDEELCKKELFYKKRIDDHALLFYRTNNNQLSLVIDKMQNVFKEKNQIKTKMIDFKKMGDKGYLFSFIIHSKNNVRIQGIYLNLRSNEKDKEVSIKKFDVTELETNKFKVNAFYMINWEEDFSPLYWDFFVESQDEKGEKGIFRINNATKKLMAQLNKDYFNDAITSDEMNIMYPYVTLGKDISIMMRNKEPFETSLNKWKEKIAFCTYVLLKPILFRKKDIWLGFEKFSKTAQDNGYAFFSYVDKNQLHENFYFVIDKESPDYKQVKEESNNVIKFMSFKYFLMVYAAKLLVSSETKRHVYNLRIRSGRVARFIDRKKSVFLQHGVTGLKRSDVFKKSKGRGNFDLVIATSDQEREIIHQNWGYSYDEIAVTGFSRWDLLTDKTKKVKRRKIFVMPTWRTWMEDMPKSDFIKSDYYNHYVSLLESEQLGLLLKEHNLQLVFFLHPKFKQYLTEFHINNENIILKEFLDIKVNEEIMESSLMISDYSSVTWDMFYLNKPIIFYQFDYEKYVEYEGSYLDMKTELFGDRALNVNELIEEVKHYIKNDFQVKTEHQELRQRYFKYIDHKNSERILEEISDMK